MFLNLVFVENTVDEKEVTNALENCTIFLH